MLKKNNLQALMLFAYFTNQTDGDNIKKSYLSTDTDIRCHLVEDNSDVFSLVE